LSNDPAPPQSIARKTARDPRLDFFRGVGMFIILYAHIPGSEFVNWIPARFGFSDATEIFVFCSGVASSFAFGAAFVKSGWRVGATRILYRIWQVYWGHVGVFVAIVAMLGWIDARLGTQFLARELNLAPFLADPGDMLARFLSLTYVPNFFDILPMYLVILALVPVVMAVARRSLPGVALLVGALWLASNLRWLELYAEPFSDRQWYFNPFGWQLVFFTGFGFGMKWLPAPRYDRRLIGLAIAVIVLAAPFSCHYGFRCYGAWGYSDWLADAHETLLPVLIDKTHLGAFRYVHFLGVAYLAFLLAGDGGSALRGWFVEAMMRVGRQTLAVFLSGLVLAQLMGVALALRGDGPLMQIAVNLGGSLGLYLVAVTVEYFKGAGKRTSPPSAPGKGKLAARTAEVGGAPLEHTATHEAATLA
jgi:hypothetical protein